MGMWQNHRERQSGKYQKRAAKAQEQLLQQQMAQMQQPPQPGGHQQGYRAAWRQGWTRGWWDGQRALVENLRSGRITLDQAAHTLGMITPRA